MLDRYIPLYYARWRQRNSGYGPTLARTLKPDVVAPGEGGGKGARAVRLVLCCAPVVRRA